MKVVLRPQPVPRAAPRAASPAWGRSDRTRLGNAQRPRLARRQVSGRSETSSLQTRYSIGHHIDSGVREALLLFQEEDWEPAIEADGTVRDGRGTNVGSSSVALARILEQRIEPYFRFPGGSS